MVHTFTSDMDCKVCAHSPKPLNWFEPNFVGSIFGEWGLKCANQGAGPFWDPEIGYNRGNYGYLERGQKGEFFLNLMNQRYLA